MRKPSAICDWLIPQAVPDGYESYWTFVVRLNHPRISWPTSGTSTGNWVETEYTRPGSLHTSSRPSAIGRSTVWRGCSRNRGMMAIFRSTIEGCAGYQNSYHPVCCSSIRTTGKSLRQSGKLRSWQKLSGFTEMRAAEVTGESMRVHEREQAPGGSRASHGRSTAVILLSIWMSTSPMLLQGDENTLIPSAANTRWMQSATGDGRLHLWSGGRSGLMSYSSSTGGVLCPVWQRKVVKRCM